ncbi:35971_t:CDS:2, partial [Gigaspora margarita]
AMTVQVTEENKEGACPYTDKKENKQNQTEQTEMDVHTQLAEVTVTDNKDTSKQSWAKMIDNDSNNLKDITNATNPWATPSTSETYAEQISTESDISYNKIERTPVGLEGLMDD